MNQIIRVGTDFIYFILIFSFTNFILRNDWKMRKFPHFDICIFHQFMDKLGLLNFNDGNEKELEEKYHVTIVEVDSQLHCKHTFREYITYL